MRATFHSILTLQQFTQLQTPSKWPALGSWFIAWSNVSTIHARNMDLRHRPFAIEQTNDTRITIVSFAEQIVTLRHLNY